ncbi:MAG TPA: alanine--tRNA ligase, partial [Anaerolineales bacterium]|nr:alanine--tRNA ligase [Anaerolineales bacterium]
MLSDFTPYRVIADHARSAAFLIADGVVPGNIGRNYICRMIIRRAARFGTKIGLTEPFLAKVAEAVIETYGGFYTELTKNRSAILDSMTREEVRFARTIESGTGQLQNLLDELAGKGGVVEGSRAFELYATYGLPLEIARDIAREQGLEVDEEGFRKAMDEHRLVSGGGKAMGKLGGEDAEFYAAVARELKRKGRLDVQGVVYDPYTSLTVEGELLALIVDGQERESASFGEGVEVILPRTGFYIESGGQVSDEGIIRSVKLLDSGEPAWQIEIRDVRRPAAGVITHVGEVIAGHPKVGDQAIAAVDMARRHDIMRNHTATHLLHAALHTVLGDHARQAGSLVAPDRLRFDFNHAEAMTEAQLRRVEKIVNDAVAADMEVAPRLRAREDAIAEGAMALFGEKYGETVRTITIVPQQAGSRYSYELCGGTHLERTSDVGLFLILSEGSAAAGVRRIEAVTGRGAYDIVRRRLDILQDAAAGLKVAPDEVPARIEHLQTELTTNSRQLTDFRRGHALSGIEGKLEQLQDVSGVGVLTMEIADADIDTLRALADRFRERRPELGVAMFASGQMLLAVVTNDLVKRGLKAAELINGIGGRGGGRPNMAQGSLPDSSGGGDALAKTAAAVQRLLKPV